MNQMNIFDRFQSKYVELVSQTRIKRIAVQVSRHEPDYSGKQPVVIFNASARITSASQGAAFAQITAWGLRMAGIPVKHFVCSEGMSRCLLGTNEDDHLQEMPCDLCVANSEKLYAGADVTWFKFNSPQSLEQKLAGLSIKQLNNFIYQKIPLGQIALPALRWRLRRHHLLDDQPTRFIYREFIKSAFNITEKFSNFLGEANPRMVIVFNGQMFPEAAVKFAAKRRGIPVVTHEAGVMPFTAFFTTGEATAYPVDIPDEFDLDNEQNKRLDEYLEQRVTGQFSMAGIKFWPEMQELDQEFLAKIEQFNQIVPIFTNVIFDTSQHHANVIFEEMFEWLDLVLKTVKQNPETLFVLRAHPDEDRPGKAAQESVGQWVEKTGFDELPNTIFIPSSQYISSYALVQHAKFVMIYNSSIGLESVLMGKPVLSAGKARFSGYPIIFFPKGVRRYQKMLDDFLKTDDVELPDEFIRNARRFLYFQLYKTSLPFGEFVNPHKLKGYVQFKKISLDQLSIKNSQTIRTIYESIINEPTFLLDTE